MMVWLLLSLLLTGCVKTLSYYERPIDWTKESNEPDLFSINLSDGSLISYPEECTWQKPDQNNGQLWYGYYFPNRVMRKQFANRYNLSTCLYDELVLGCHPFRIGGYPWPIPMGSCKEIVSKEATP